MIKKIVKVIKEHKVTSVVVFLALVALFYFVFQVSRSESESISYEFEKVSRGDIKTLVSVTGQVGDADQTDISLKVTGEVKSIAVSEGQEVKEGDVLLEIDSEDLEDDIYQAKLALEAAQLNLEELKEPDELSIEKAENDLRAARYDLAELELKQSHELEKAQEDMQSAKDNIENLDEDSADYDNKLQTYESQLKEAERTIEEYNQNHPIEIARAENSIREKEKNLDDIREGPTDTEISMQENTIKEKRSNLENLEEQRDDYTVKAPSNTIVAEININEGDSISGGGTSSSGSSSGSDTSSSGSDSVITLVSKNKNAVISINEVDLPNIKEGQEVDLTFDALEDLEITGKVSNISKVSTADQGVVYNDVTISFNSQDERIMNGMTVNADIITNNKEDVLMVSESVVKSQADGDYVEVLIDKEKYTGDVSGLENIETQMVKVETGITDDINIEILSGLNEDDIVVSKKIESDDNDEDDDDSAEKENNNSLMPMGPGSMDRQGRN